MTFTYYPETDTLQIKFANRPGADAHEISDGIIADFDENGIMIGLEIDPASKVSNLEELIFANVPVRSIQFIQATPSSAIPIQQAA